VTGRAPTQPAAAHRVIALFQNPSLNPNPDFNPNPILDLALTLTLNLAFDPSEHDLHPKPSFNANPHPHPLRPPGWPCHALAGYTVQHPGLLHGLATALEYAAGHDVPFLDRETLLLVSWVNTGILLT